MANKVDELADGTPRNPPMRRPTSARHQCAMCFARRVINRPQFSPVALRDGLTRVSGYPERPRHRGARDWYGAPLGFLHHPSGDRGLALTRASRKLRFLRDRQTPALGCGHEPIANLNVPVRPAVGRHVQREL
jgi:hypothetical protein